MQSSCTTGLLFAFYMDPVELDGELTESGTKEIELWHVVRVVGDKN